jgi:tetratricopeptide (TPR) repeat protein
MADVENRTDDSLLARQVQESLTLALQQSRLTSIVSRERVGEALERMKRARDGAVDERTALEICQREGIPAVLSVSAARSGRATKITVKALQAEGASLLFAESVDYDEAAGFFRPIDDLAKRVRLRLGESLSEIQLNLKSLAQATTSSTEALRQYTRALDARAMGRSDEIEAPLLAALRLDPDFAMAHLKLADYYGNVAGDTLKALPELDAAYRLRDRVPPREQSLITAEYFENHAQLEKSRETLKILATLYPKDPEVRYALALRHYNLEELKSAIAEVREAVRLDPHAVRPYGGLVLFLARDNQAQAALAAAGDALAAGLDSPQLRWAYGLALLGVDKVAEARVEFAGFSQGSGYEAHLAQLQLARASLYEGNLRDASDWFTRLLEDAHRTGERSFERVARVQLARTAALMGDRALVRQQSVKLEALSKGTPMPPVDLLESGHVALVAGYRAIVQAQLARLRAQEKSNATPLVRAARLLLESEVAFADRHFALAAQLQNEALVLRPWAMYSRTRAEALERLGDWPAASKAWQVILDARGQILQDGFPPDLAAAREGLARAGARVQQPVRKEP